jgi:hypothetical protein
MKKISYNLVLNAYYPDAKWLVVDGGKGYQYDSYVWDTANTDPKPSQSDLDAKWEELKRSTDLWKKFLDQRVQRLQDTDYLMMPDYPYASEQSRQAWADYRQALRDLPETSEPYYDANGQVNIAWPQKPN